MYTVDNITEETTRNITITSRNIIVAPFMSGVIVGISLSFILVLLLIIARRRMSFAFDAVMKILNNCCLDKCRQKCRQNRTAKGDDDLEEMEPLDISNPILESTTCRMESLNPSLFSTAAAATSNITTEYSERLLENSSRPLVSNNNIPEENTFYSSPPSGKPRSVGNPKLYDNLPRATGEEDDGEENHYETIPTAAATGPTMPSPLPPPPPPVPDFPDRLKFSTPLTRLVVNNIIPPAGNNTPVEKDFYSSPSTGEPRPIVGKPKLYNNAYLSMKKEENYEVRLIFSTPIEVTIHKLFDETENKH